MNFDPLADTGSDKDVITDPDHPLGKWRTPALDALSADDAEKLKQLIKHDYGHCSREQVWYSGGSVSEYRRLRGWTKADRINIPAFMPGSLKRRGLEGAVGDTMLDVAKKSGKSACAALLDPDNLRKLAVGGENEVSANGGEDGAGAARMRGENEVRTQRIRRRKTGVGYGRGGSGQEGRK